jgi:N-acetylglucosaminyl-diphospho-decaprenol L-rhamnosyltransferase
VRRLAPCETLLDTCGHRSQCTSHVNALPPASSALERQTTIVMVLYNSAEVVEDCLVSLPEDCEVIVVDNGSLDDGAERAQASRPGAVVIRCERNLGFGAGCNLGWRASSRPYLAFINPDVRLRASTLPILLHRLTEVRRNIVGPALLDEAGIPRPCKRRPSALLDLCGMLPAAARWAPAGWDGKLAREDPLHSSGGGVACVEGACFVMRREDLDAIGGFDEDFFLYYEEESLACRLKRLGGSALYEPRAIAEHAGGASTRKIGSVATRHLHRSRVIFYRKRDGDLRGVLSGLLLAFGVLVSAVGAALNAALGRRRPVTLAHLWQVLTGLVAGMTASLDRHISY